MKQVDKEIVELKEELIVLTKDIINIYQDLLVCTESFDDACLKEVIKKDKVINEKEVIYNDKVIEYIATFSPIATDLRESISYLKIANELERIADYTTNIAKIFRREISFSSYEIKKIKHGIKLVIEFLEGSEEIISNYSTSLAYELVENDEELNELYKSFYSDQIVNYSKEKSVEAIVSTVSILKYLERAGDHIINIIEHMVYAQKAQFVNL